MDEFKIQPSQTMDCCENSSTIIFYWIFFIYAGNKDNHKVSDEFEIPPVPTMDCGVSCPRASEKIPIDLQWEKDCDHSSAFIFDCNFFILAGNKDMLKRLDEFQFQPLTAELPALECLKNQYIML